MAGTGSLGPPAAASGADRLGERGGRGGGRDVVKTPRAESIGNEIRALAKEAAPQAPMDRVFTMAGLAADSMVGLSSHQIANLPDLNHGVLTEGAG